MQKTFKTIGLIGRQRKEREDIRETLTHLQNTLIKKGFDVVVDQETASCFPAKKLKSYPREKLGKYCDLMIVVGGDGSLLNAARAAVLHQTPLLGINRGKLGFLTDIHPNEVEKKVLDVLKGNYIEEERFLLNATVSNRGKKTSEEMALNDIVLMPGDIAHMIEFSIAINGQFVCNHRADGLIIATPTGSTAYALSGGGPIIHPQLDAMVLVPMFPHTLTSRPLVVSAESEIVVTISKDNETSPRLSCDGQARVSIPLGAEIHIQKFPKKMQLIHPKDYSYFSTLREKLYWNAK